MADRIHTISQEATEPHQLSDIVRAVLDDVSRIVRGEIRLARIEIREIGRRSGGALLLLGVAAVAGLLAAACFVTTCIAALALAMPVWLAALLVGIVLGLAGGGLYAAGRKRFANVDVVPQQTVDSMRGNIQWLKQRSE